MADYIVKDTELISVANAIRTAGGTSGLLTFPNGFANAINNISGGSSDFSTATVTIISNHPVSVEYQGAIIFADMTDSVGYVDPNTSVAFQVILYKGTAFAGLLSSGGADITVTGTTGAVENDGTDLEITGDCTITIS